MIQSWLWQEGFLELTRVRAQFTHPLLGNTWRSERSLLEDRRIALMTNKTRPWHHCSTC